jgi:hypothetical protein
MRKFGPNGRHSSPPYRPASQKRIKALMERGFHRLGDVENHLGFYVGQIGG